MRVVCGGCSGAGSRILVTQANCLSCNGRGYTPQWQQPNNPNEHFSQAPGNVHCASCSGRGTTDHRNFAACVDCSGSGSVGGDNDEPSSHGDYSYVNNRFYSIPPRGSGQSPKPQLFGTRQALVETTCCLFIFFIFLCWWGLSQPTEYSQSSLISPHLVVYQYLASLWSLFFIPAAVFLFTLKYFIGEISSIAILWSRAVVACFFGLLALIGSGLMFMGVISVVVTMLAALISGVASIILVFPALGAKYWRMWATGFLVLILMGCLNILIKPASIPNCLVLKDVRLWIAIQPLTQPFDINIRSEACIGVHLQNAGKYRIINPTSSGLTNNSYNLTVLSLLVDNSTGKFGYERSMAALFAVFSAIFALNAVFLGSTFKILLILVGRFVEYRGGRVIKNFLPRWLSLVAFLLTFFILLIWMVREAKMQTPEISVTPQSSRLLLLLAVSQPALVLSNAAAQFLGEQPFEDNLKYLHERIKWQRKQQ